MTELKNKIDLPAKRTVLLYGDVNLNVTDGSAIWLVSMAEALSRTNSHVSVLLKAPELHDRLSGRLREMANVTVIPHSEETSNREALTPRYAARRIAALDSSFDFDVIITRGFRIAQAIATSVGLLRKSWVYITDLPTPMTKVTSEQLEALDKIASGAKRLFAQTEDARSYLEALTGHAAGKVVLLSPMIPDEFFVPRLKSSSYDEDTLRLVYSGKFAKDWRTLEMTQIPEKFQQLGIKTELTMVGDKFQDDKADPTWASRMRAAIEAPGVNWVGGMTRAETVKLAGKHDIGLGWRTEKLESSLELSTKLLEYAAAGVPPAVNRTAAHEELFGSDYPLFIEDDSFDSISKTLNVSDVDLDKARITSWNVAKKFSMSQASHRLEKMFERVEGTLDLTRNETRKLKVVLAGHDFKFAGELISMLEGSPNVDLKIDKWITLHKNDENSSRKLLEWADLVICEWAGPNSVWYSKNVSSAQRLIVRLHAFELNGPWLGNIQVEAIDRIVCVSDLYKRKTIEKMGLEESKVSTIPNALDFTDLERAKKSGHEHRIGLVGIVPFIKRPDRAVDVLEGLLTHDDRFTLHIKGRMPWEYLYEWNKPLQREAYAEFFARIASNDFLRSRIAFEPFGADMGSWLRKIGYVLSPSTRESFHLAPAEGMASGAVPIVWNRPGAEEIFGSQFVVDSSRGAIDMILDLVSDREKRSQLVNDASTVARGFDLIEVGRAWNRIIEEIFSDDN